MRTFTVPLTGILVCLLASCSLRLDAQNYWQQQVDYKIDVSLDDREKTLDGFADIRYTNHSPDTLRFIWFHLWPNAYRNDETAFSDQLLGNGRTDYYFSDKEQKGYINRLDFRVDGTIAATEDHPQYIDIEKVVLPHPLVPGGTIRISTPFHEKLPYVFSGSGYTHGNFQITHWYPAPAVYDRNGWHPMPYLDQGGGYAEYGHFEVTITLPKDYVVAATGRPSADPDGASTASGVSPPDALRTIRYAIGRANDFAWFADKRYHRVHDTLQLPSGRIIDLDAYYYEPLNIEWPQAIEYMKSSIRFRSALLGEYPYDEATVVQIRNDSPDSVVMNAKAYPTLATIASPRRHSILDFTIDQALGRSWLAGALGTDGQRASWVDAGLNAWCSDRYRNGPGHKYFNWPPELRFPREFYPGWPRIEIDALAVQRLDQPISTPADSFSAANYRLITSEKTKLWLQQLERSLGRPLFDSCIREYLRTWQFRHPASGDFRLALESTSGRDLGAAFAQLDQKGPMPPPPLHRPHRFLKVGDRFSRADSISLIHILPAFGYNKYDDFMAGVLLTNYNAPPDRFQYLLAPMYAHESKQFTGLGRIGYSWFPAGAGDAGAIHRVNLSVAGDRFSTSQGVDSSGHLIFGGFYKLTPSLRITFNNRDARSTREDWIEWKTYLIGERALDHYVYKASDSTFYPTRGKYVFRYVNQLTLFISDRRVLYPHSASFQIQQASEWVRANFEGSYFFNYAKGGGIDVRLFAAKFGFIGGGNSSLDLSRFEPKLTAVRGDEDYTYSDYFIGRNEFTGYQSQQIMMRDGGLKIRTDLFQGLQGRSDNWVAAMNFTSTLPRSLVPPWLPLRVFFDIGTYAEAWQPNPLTDKFLYTGGLQLSLFRDVLNIYAPLFYSGVFGDNLKTVPDENGFLKKISFSIDIQHIHPKQLDRLYDL